MKSGEAWVQELAYIERNHWWYQARREIIKYVFLNDKSKKTSNILSIGASTGAELEFLKNYGKVSAIDIDDLLIKFCHSKGFTVLKEDLSCCTLPEKQFDLIFAMDVLEHIPKHYDAFKHLVRMLKPGGQAFITVPAHPWLWSEMDEFDHHQRRYTKKELKALLSSRNVILKKFSYFQFFLFPLQALTILFGVSSDNVMKVPHSLVNFMLQSIFGLEKRILQFGNLPFGSSLLAIIEKRSS